ncbi:hypothetical protein [Actinomadura bangladeshensis]|uniref:Uncharacterized protein n=1 Tax=Actinomadura bangladeshensis TaxID=453573 RepID=A0A4R4NCY0_9ACTN|nr:hypothetical protein [Actinomadura bangladeshensis]TDC05260.1 hypothetical protein E1284_35705 [Actinomadura bangladeshensis]
MWQVNTSMAVLRNTVTDADGDTANLTFEVWTTDASGNPKAQVKLTDANPYGVLVSDFVASGKTAQVTVPSGALKPGVTYAFHTSAYDGSLYETTWSPWAKFKIRNRAVDIKLPEPDKDAPTLNQDDFQQPQQIPQPAWDPDVPSGGQPGTQSAPAQSVAPRIDGRKGWSCGALNEKTGIQPCTRIVRNVNDKTSKALAAAMAQIKSAPLVDWCAGLANSHIKRYEACLATFTYEYEGVIIRDGKPTGEVINASWAIHHEYQLRGNSGLIAEKLVLFPVGPIDSRFGRITLNVDFNCVAANCVTDTTSMHWDGALEWAPLVDEHIAEGTINHSWTGGAVTGVTENVYLSTKISAWAQMANPSAARYGAADAAIRCDTVSQNTPGCTFSKYVPTWTFNTKKYPAAAAHAWLIQAKSPNHPGVKQYDKPMLFLPAAGKNSWNRDPQKNRDVICPTGWAKTYGHPETTRLTEISSTDVASCDEFAFAASYNSGGMPATMDGLNPVTSGDQCLQTYAKRVTQGEWHLYDDERKPAPTFQEVCGRSAMSNWMNTGSMAPFSGGFSLKYRLLDKDPYWVDTPGFQNCDAAAVPVQCTVTLP